MTKNIAIIGAQFGDEGKAKITHHFSRDYDYVIRTSGGANAGHTVYRNGKKYVHHLVPTIDFINSNAKGFIASGVVIDLKALYEELSLFEQDFPGVSKRITIDPDAFAVLPEHIAADQLITKIKSTNRGIGPCHVDKMSRKGTKVRDLLLVDSDYCLKLKRLGVSFKYIMELYDEFKQSDLLFEGSQSILLDLNAGIYPYVSCGDSTPAGIYACGFHFVKLDAIYGIAKAYLTKVGGGPMMTEIFGDEAERLRVSGLEYGSTTGRPRRIGYMDLPALRFSARRGGITKLIITKFDILNGMETVPVCNSYQKEVVSAYDFFDAVPSYINLPGWNDARNLEEIKPFIQYVENYVGLPVEYISYGTDDKSISKL